MSILAFWLLGENQRCRNDLGGVDLKYVSDLILSTFACISSLGVLQLELNAGAHLENT